MLRRFTVAVAALLALASQVFAAGTIPYSLSQQLDEFGKPLAGCKLYLIQAGTVSTPQNGYSDSGLTLVLPNPLICTASGRLPQFFLADGSIKVRLTKSNGVTVVTADGILVVGASSGGGGGSPVDATTVLATGDVKPRYGTGALSGFVRLNGRTIGSATSGATERANADCQALFEYLWGADANLAVSTGRGLTANADWTANKTLTLPDLRGRMIAGLDDMGNTAASRLTSATITGPTTLGAAGGTETKTIAQGNLPNVNFFGTAAVTINNILVKYSTGNFAAGVNGAVTGINFTLSNTGNTSTVNSDSGAATVASGGSGTALSSMPPVMLITIYVKL